MKRHHTNKRGSVLIIVMVVVFAIAAMVLSLGRQARVQVLASANDLSQQKADAAERGAEQYVLSLLTDYRETLSTLTEEHFSAVPVGDAFVWIIRPTFNDVNTPAWGLVDESSKLSLNTVTYAQLMALPNMTDELANAIVQWRGPDAVSETSTDTASVTAAPPAALVTGGVTKNAPFETVDELLLVPGMTRELLYGPPATAAPTESANSGTGESWALAHGLFDFFTAWSTAPNTASDGTARVSYNRAEDRDAFTALLGEKLGSVTRGNEIRAALTTGGRRPQPVQSDDLFDFATKAGLKQEELALIEDFVTDNSETVSLKGRVNVNTAPREVLLALGVLSETDVDTLMSRRTEAAVATPNSVAWILDALKDKAVGLGNLVTARGRQFSADIVAASGNGRGFRHVRIVVDTTSSPARIVYRRDLTDRGWPLEPQLLEQLKAGQFVAAPGTAQASGRASGVR